MADHVRTLRKRLERMERAEAQSNGRPVNQRDKALAEALRAGIAALEKGGDAPRATGKHPALGTPYGELAEALKRTDRARKYATAAIMGCEPALGMTAKDYDIIRANISGGTAHLGSTLGRVRDFLVDQEKCASFLEPIERAGLKAYYDLVYDHGAVKAGLAPRAREWVTDAAISAVLTSIHTIAQRRMPTVKLGPNVAEELLSFGVRNKEELDQALRDGYRVEILYWVSGRWKEARGVPYGFADWPDFFKSGGKARAVKA